MPGVLPRLPPCASAAVKASVGDLQARKDIAIGMARSFACAQLAMTSGREASLTTIFKLSASVTEAVACGRQQRYHHAKRERSAAPSLTCMYLS